MSDIQILQKKKDIAQKNYHVAKEKLALTAGDSLVAQEANDAWLKLKKLEKEVEQFLFMKKLGDLYGC